MTDTVNVACGAGFAGDRIEPAVEFAASGLVDAVVLECLAERTMATGLIERAADPGAGFDRRWRRRLTPLLPAARATGTSIVSNLGSANPVAAGAAIVGLARELGLGGLRVAALVGDDINDRADAVTWSDLADDGEWLGVHAYLGAEQIAEALQQGADVVVTGRTADSALFAAPAMARLDLDEAALAGVMTVGHLLECGGQLTGGNLADLHHAPLDPKDFATLGYPVAEVARDGTAEIGVLPGKPARLDAISCTLQLLYEVHDPTAYLTPDVTLDFGGLRIDEIGHNRVRVSGARGHGRPERLKAIGFRKGRGMMADAEIAYAGNGAADRARAAAETMALRLESLGIARFGVDLVGVDSVLGARATHPSAEPPAEARMHVSAVCADAELALAVEDELYTLTLAGPAGGCCMRSERRPHLLVESGLVDRDLVPAQLEWLTA